LQRLDNKQSRPGNIRRGKAFKGGEGGRAAGAEEIRRQILRVEEHAPGKGRLDLQAFIITSWMSGEQKEIKKRGG